MAKSKKNLHNDKVSKETINVLLPKELVGHYSNIVNISSTKDEVFFDFIIRGPAGPSDCKVVCRIVMSKGHSSQFSKVLSKSIKKIK